MHAVFPVRTYSTLKSGIGTDTILYKTRNQPRSSHHHITIPAQCTPREKIYIIIYDHYNSSLYIEKK